MTSVQPAATDQPSSITQSEDAMLARRHMKVVPRSIDRLMAVARRWVGIVSIGVIGSAGAFVATMWRSSTLGAVSADRHQPWFIWLVASLGTLVLLLLLERPLRAGGTPSRYWLAYPPLWLSVVLSLALVGLLGTVPFSQVPARWGEWRLWFLLAASFFVSVALLRRISSRRRRIASITSGGVERTWPALAQWFRREGPVSPADPDLFGGKPMACRIARLLSQPWGCDVGIALIGPFGGGKSSVLTWVEAELAAASDRDVWFCKVSCWGLDGSATAPAHVLDAAVGEVERHVDAITLRGLSSDYQRLLSAEPTGIGAKIGDMLSSRSEPLAKFRSLSDVLCAVNARLVICIEDADRTGSDFDPQHIQRLLWTLRDVKGISFVLAVDPKQAAFDFSKVCDHVEVLPAVDVDQVRAILRELHSHCRSRLGIDSVAERTDTDLLGLKEAQGELEAYARRVRRGALVDSIADLVDTPRKLKHLARRIGRIWNSLAGEIDLEDLIIVTALREGSPESFEFLVREIDAIRHAGRNTDDEPAPIKTAWKEHLKSAPKRPAVDRLVECLAFEALAPPNQKRRPQGVAEHEPNDYFRRLLAEEIAPGVLRDQEVLREIGAWLGMGEATGPDKMLSRLVAANDGDRRYVQLWEHFSSLVPPDRLLSLADAILGVIQARDATLASASHPALLAVWRVSNIRLGRTAETTAWVVSAIRRALPVSLALANETYFFWASARHGIVDDEGRAAVRRAVMSEAQKLYGNDSERLWNVLHADNPTSIRRLMTPADREESAGSVMTDVADWVWLADPVLGLTTNHGEGAAPYVAHVVGDFQGSHRFTIEGAEPKFETRETYTLNRARTVAMFGARADDVVRYLAQVPSDLTHWYVREAGEQARQWLTERASGDASIDVHLRQ